MTITHKRKNIPRKNEKTKQDKINQSIVVVIEKYRLEVEVEVSGRGVASNLTWLSPMRCA